MSHDRISNSPWMLERLSVVYLYLLVSLLPLGILFAVWLGQPSLAVSGLLIFGPALFGSILVLYSMRNATTPVPSLTYEIDSRILQTAFVAVFSASIVVLVMTPYRPWYYFVLVAFLYVLVLIQILANASPTAVIGQLVSLVLGWTYGLTLNYAFYFGGTSTLVHRFYAELTLASGSTIPGDLSLYAYFPLYHVFVAGTAELLGISVESTLMAVVPIPFLATIALVYKLFAGISGNDQTGLLTALLYSAQPIVLYYAPYMITRTMAFVGFLALVYVAYSRNRFTTFQYTSLIVFFALFTTIVHHVSVPQILSLLAVLACCEYVLMDRRFSIYPFAVLTTISAIYWAIFARPVLVTLIDIYAESDNYDEAETVSSADQSLHHITYYLNNHVLIFLVLIGIGVLLWRYRDRYEVVFGVFALVTLALYVPSPLHALSQTLHFFRVDRYVLLLSPFVGFVMAIGILGIHDRLRGPVRSSGRTIAVVGLVCLLVLSSVTVSGLASNASDSRDLSWTGPPMHFTNEEMQGFEFVEVNVPSDSRLEGDWQTMRYYRPMTEEFSGADEHDVPIYDRTTLNEVDDIHDREGYLILRKAQLEQDGLLFGGQGVGQRELYQDEQRLYDRLERDDKVYDNGEIEIHRTSAREQ